MLNRKFVAAFSVMFTTSVAASDNYSPYVDRDTPTSVYFGDTHLHTGLSSDAYMLGNRSLGREEAYRFAKGETVVIDKGREARLARPLDFLVIADHAENIGVMQGLFQADPVLLNTLKGAQLYEKYKAAAAEVDRTGDQSLFWSLLYWDVKHARFADQSFAKGIWQHVIASADKYNDPGKFSAFIGYEWTLSGENPHRNVHRVVVFRDGAEQAGQVQPFSENDSKRPEDLWAYMASYQEQTGGEVMAIPHNPNLSAGRMFELKDSDGKAFSAPYAKLRARWEPLLEMTQIKGDSETHPLLSPDDEFAEYDTWPGKARQAPDWEKLIRYEYARSALKLGIGEQARMGVNPFKFGMIGSTDAHTSLSTVGEMNFWGKFAINYPSPDRAAAYLKVDAAPWSAAGFAAVWAKENTRESLFAAMKRRETYATTGPRMMVRFFGGWGYQAESAFKPDLAKIGYAGGVPMGGDLTHAPKGKVPSFLIRAVKDPDGANLDRVQVIKGWRSAGGELREKIYNVALSEGRKDKGSKTKAVGSTVKVQDASYTNTIGAAELATMWRDPDFNPDELAFYYVRVIEIPTPRWAAYDAKYFDIKDMPDEVPMVTQERAYTSPIWYTP